LVDWGKKGGARKGEHNKESRRQKHRRKGIHSIPIRRKGGGQGRKSRKNQKIGIKEMEPHQKKTEPKRNREVMGKLGKAHKK